MPRLPRIYQQSICYHLMNRGWNRQTVMRDDLDRRFFTQTVIEYKAICGAKLYHWAWMRTHFHMLVEVVFDNLRPFAAGIEQVYAQYHHRRHGTCGHFWQGRFKSKPVEPGSYLINCAQYIERNPVRDNTVDQAWEYRWSSAAHYVCGRRDWLTDTNPYLAFDLESTKARQQYAEALGTDEADALVIQWHGHKVIGDERFASRLRLSHGRHRRKRGQPVRRNSIHR